ncbi:MAG: hypothetical protein RLZZ252_1839 [Bacteroidota bacterium]|jgi:hypothetical protein
MDAISSKISNKAIAKLVFTAFILALINTVYYWINDHYILSGDPNHPHRPPFDNLALRMLIREITIWLFFFLNLSALKINGLNHQRKILLFGTIIFDIATIAMAVIRLIWDNEVFYQIYSSLLALLNSNWFFTILVILHYIALTMKRNKPTN